MSTDLSSIPRDPLLEEGARNAVRVCLDVQPDERAALITDRETLAVGAALAHELSDAAESVETIVLESLAERPISFLPIPVEVALERAHVSIFAAASRPRELALRRGIISVVNAKKLRHAHMVGITPRIMQESMRADYGEVSRLTQRVCDRAQTAQVITCKTPGGTDLRVQLDPALRWVPTPGPITAQQWGNLPGGETFTCPARVDGTYVVDGVLGDWLAAEYGDMRATPLRITIENSRIVGTSCENEQAREDFRIYTSTDANSNRVGEVGLGTNTAIQDLIGNMLQDEKIPGVHLAFGHPYPESTQAPWRSTTHIDVVGREFDAWFDGEQIMRAGRYLI